MLKPRGLDRVWKLLITEKCQKSADFRHFSDILENQENHWILHFSVPREKCQKDARLRLEFCKSDQNDANKTQNDTTMTPQWHHSWLLYNTTRDSSMTQLVTPLCLTVPHWASLCLNFRKTEKYLKNSVIFRIFLEKQWFSVIFRIF